MTDGQLFVVLGLIAVAIAAVCMVEVDYRRVRAARRDWDAHVETALDAADPNPIYTATARALADTTAEFRDRAEAGRALVGDLTEEGRRLATRRDDLIAAGVDPAELLVPLHPNDAADGAGWGKGWGWRR